MLGFRWSICLLVCLAVALSGCRGPIPWLHPRPAENGIDEWEREYDQEEYREGTFEGPTMEPPTLDRSNSQPGSFSQPSASPIGELSPTENAQLNSMLEQLGSFDPDRRYKLERLIAGSHTLQTITLQGLPECVKDAASQSAQTANAKAELESLLTLPEGQSGAGAPATANPATGDTWTRQEFERTAVSFAAVPSPQLFDNLTVARSSDINWLQDVPPVEPPPSNTGYAPNRRDSGDTFSSLPTDGSLVAIESTMDPDVTSVSHEASTPFGDDLPLDTSWREHLDSTIRVYESELSDAPESKSELDAHVAAHARLRLLKVAADDRDYAEDIPAAAPAVQDFWKDELFALHTLLDTQGSSNASDRFSVAADHMELAGDRLSQMSKLKVENTTFVREVESWGVYTPFSSTDFPPGTPVMIYAEMKNFVSNDKNPGHETQLRGGYEIFAQYGGSMVEHEFAVVSEICRNQRHDYFVRYQFNLPSSINPGNYTLRLTITDMNDGSISQDDVDFSIVSDTP